MSITPIRGRPFGGRSFIFNKSLDIKNYSFINKHISFCSFSFHNNVFTIISVHLPFDNKSFLNFSIFTSSLQIIKELFNFFSLKNHSVIILGDFNADLTRNNRFDITLNNFLFNNNFHCVSPSLDNNEFTYHNGSYKAKLDHCFISNNEWNMFINCSFLDNIINLSDHKPVQLSISFNVPIRNFIDYNKNDENLNELKIIKLSPNLENEEINKKFNQILLDQMKLFENITIDNESNKQNTINIQSLYINN
jgi:hypothetical protein